MRRYFYPLFIGLICLSLGLGDVVTAQASVQLQAPPAALLPEQANNHLFMPLIDDGKVDGPDDLVDGPKKPPPDEVKVFVPLPKLDPPLCQVNDAQVAPTLAVVESTAGYTGGNFSVSASGATAYQIPLVVAPGTGGMVPSLGLSYSSQGGNGIAGMGWALTGLSSISRCPANLARHGVVDGVDFDDNDQFCLDGQPLYTNDGVNGADGTHYHTEIESFSRIISTGRAGQGPASFKVWTKSGLIMEYGTQAGARLTLDGLGVLVWAVNRIEDMQGNYLTVTYDTNGATGEQYPREIQYTGNAAANLEPYQRVEFAYEARPDVVQRYFRGRLLQTTQRLQYVRSMVRDDAPTLADPVEVLRTYHFTYDTSQATGTSRLVSLQECGGQGVCLQPTTFRWSEGAGGFTSAVWPNDTAEHMYNGGGTTADYRVLPGDYDGDGKTDIATISRAVVDNSGWQDNIYVELSTGGGFESQIWPAVTPRHMYNGHASTSDYQIIPGDYNADGKTDLAAISRVASTENAWYSNIFVELSNGSGFTSLAWPANTPIHMHNGGGETLDYQVLPGDFNGDGRTDLATVKRAGGTDEGWYEWIAVELSTGSGFDSQRWPAVLPKHMLNGGGHTSDYRILPGDYNGDGLTDLAAVSRATDMGSGWYDSIYLALSTGSGFESPAWPAILPGHMFRGGGATQNYQVIPGDYNGDGLTDLAAIGRALSEDNGWRSNIYVELSSGVGFVSQAWASETPGHMYRGNEETLDFRVASGDFNGDNRTDLVTIGRAPSEDNGWLSNVFVDIALTDRFDSQAWEAVTPRHMYNGGGDTADYQTVTGNFDGDRKTDIATFHRAAGRNGWVDWAAMELTNASYPDLMVEITNGHGAKIGVDYKLLTDAALYERGDGATYPQMDVQAPIYVVAAFHTSNGLGGTSHASYTYAGLRINVRGRGSRGFAHIETVDQQTGIKTRTTYRQDFPYTGMIAKSERYAANGKLIAQVENQWGVLETVSHAAYFPYLQQSVSHQYELDGKLIDTTTTTQEVDSVGNVTKMSVVHGDGWRQTTINSYADDMTRWWLGRLVRATVTAEAPGQPAQTRTASFAYDATSGLLIEEVTEPDHASLALTKRYQHDSFGNIVRSTTSGAGIEERSQNSEYDRRGQFAIKVTNALGHTEMRLFDPRTGQVKEVTGPNGLTTVAEYDRLGRLVLSIAPDGVQTVQTRRRCDGDCPPNAVAYTRTDRAGVAPIIEYVDLLDRVIRQESVGWDGRALLVDTEYNEAGWVKHVSEPYFARDGILWTTYEYDAVGRVVRKVLPDGNTVTATFAGFTTRTVNVLGQSSTRTLDSQGHLVQSTDSQAQSIAYRYDAFGNLVELLDPLANKTTFQYDLRGNKVAMNDPDSGTTIYRYNVLGELVDETDARGQISSMRYDRLGRMVERTDAAGSSTWHYDSADMGVGKLANVQGPGEYGETYLYDQLGRNVRTDITIEDVTYSTCTQFDSFSRMAKLTYPTGFAVTYRYDARGNLVEVGNAADSTVYWRLDRMNARGQVEQQSLGNGLVTHLGYQRETGRLATIQTGTAADPSVVQKLGYTFDALGNLSMRQDARQNVTESFDYDTLNRLTTWQVTGQAAQSALYDALGNITFRSDVGSYTYGANGAGPHAVTEIVGPRSNHFGYDASGNRTEQDGGSVEYTTFGKPRKISLNDSVVTFDYDANHTLYRQSNTQGGQTTTLYFLGLLEVEMGPASTIQRHHIQASNGVVAMHERRSDGQRQDRYLHRDHLGSIDTITDGNREVVERLSFDAWGKRRLPDWRDTAEVIQSISNRGYTGHLQLDDVGLVHMGGRVYDPAIGRFLSADPFVQAPENSQSLNRYSYVLNNPLSYTDPSGYSLFSKIGHWVKEGFDWIKDNWKTIAVAALTVATAYWGGFTLAPAIFGTNVSPYVAGIVGGTTSGFAHGVSATLLNGGDLGDALGSGLKGAAQAGAMAVLLGGSANLKIGKDIFGAESFIETASSVARNVAHNVANRLVTKYVIRPIANAVGVSTEAFNLGFTGLSFAGDILTGYKEIGRYGRMAEAGNGKPLPIFLGILNRVKDMGAYSLAFDTVDIMLGYQGLLTATGWKYALGQFGSSAEAYCHSLGTLDCSNLVGRGLLDSATAFSLPFGNIAPSGVNVVIGANDIVNGFFLGKVLNPTARFDTTPCESLVACHELTGRYHVNLIQQ